MKRAERAEREREAMKQPTGRKIGFSYSNQVLSPFTTECFKNFLSSCAGKSVR